MWKNQKAVSPVIATIILLAVVITTSFTVALWTGGVSTQYVQHEKIEVGTAQASSSSSWSLTTWTITVPIKNSGTSTATITGVYLNDKPLANSGAANPPSPDAGNGGWYAASPVLASGSSGSLVVVVRSGGAGQPFTSLSPGVCVNLRLHSASGMDYVKLVELP